MKGSTSDGSYIDARDLIQYWYCPRKIYFLNVLGVPVQLKRKMELGKKEHFAEAKRLSERAKVFGFPREDLDEIAYKMHLSDRNLGLNGVVDAVLRLKSGEVIPIEMKYTEYLEPTIGRRKQLVDITVEDKRSLVKDLESLRRLMRSEAVPRRADGAKCAYCEVEKYCSP